MTIRLAEPADLARIVEMGTLFVAESEYWKLAPASPSRMEALVSAMAASPRCVVLVAEVDGAVVGMVGGQIYAHPMLEAFIASEVAWWVDPPHRSGRVGVALMKRFEQWAKDAGATHTQMVAPTERVGAFYEQVGYSKVEMSYVRRV